MHTAHTHIHIQLGTETVREDMTHIYGNIVEQETNFKSAVQTHKKRKKPY